MTVDQTTTFTVDDLTGIVLECRQCQSRMEVRTLDANPDPNQEEYRPPLPAKTMICSVCRAKFRIVGESSVAPDFTSALLNLRPLPSSEPSVTVRLCITAAVDRKL